MPAGLSFECQGTRRAKLRWKRLAQLVAKTGQSAKGKGKNKGQKGKGKTRERSQAALVARAQRLYEEEADEPTEVSAAPSASSFSFGEGLRYQSRPEEAPLVQERNTTVPGGLGTEGGSKRAKDVWQRLHDRFPDVVDIATSNPGRSAKIGSVRAVATERVRQGLGPLSGQPARPTGPTEDWGATSRALSTPTLTHKPTTAYSSSEDEAAAKEEETSEPPGRSRSPRATTVVSSRPNNYPEGRGRATTAVSSRPSNYVTSEDEYEYESRDTESWHGGGPAARPEPSSSSRGNTGRDNEGWYELQRRQRNWTRRGSWSSDYSGRNHWGY